VNHRAAPCIRHIPFAVDLFREINGIDGTEVNAYAASFTGDWVNCERRLTRLITIHSDGIEPTSRQTGSASNTIFLPDSSLSAATEFTAALYSRLKDEMQVSGINVTVSQDLALSKHGK
jgi:hypothetical protein